MFIFRNAILKGWNNCKHRELVVNTPPPSTNPTPPVPPLELFDDTSVKRPVRPKPVRPKPVRPKTVLPKTKGMYIYKVNLFYLINTKYCIYGRQSTHRVPNYMWCTEQLDLTSIITHRDQLLLRKNRNMLSR